jgi:acyl-coenzyme A synthetase/AMP-(fatty) acid ligase
MTSRVSRLLASDTLVPAGEWAEAAFLAGDPDEQCLLMGSPVERRELRRQVAAQQGELAAAGLGAGGTVALHLPPSLAFVASLLAAWGLGAQVSLLDHRLARSEIDRALERLAPQVVVSAEQVTSAPMAGYSRATPLAAARPGGRPAQTPHVLIQLSSGSTGPSKVIARTAADLLSELDRYQQLELYPRRGERIVLLASIVHVLGLVGGLLHSLHADVQLVFPDRLTADGIRKAVAAGPEPTMILGVPFHAELLAAAPRPVSQLTRMVVAGELVRPGVPESFTAGYGVPLGTMYGMTEVGMIATDLSGRHRPAVAPAPGMALRVADGQLLVQAAASPYIGLVDPGRWSDGWLATRDAGTIDGATGLVTVLGRLDSQIAIGGLKVDLTEVEQTLGALPEVTSAVVAFDGAIEAYLVLAQGCAAADVEAAMADQLAPYKRPRILHVLAALPRTATGKIVRDRTVLQAAAGAAATVPPPAGSR